jgi:hypothetical protein
VCSEHRRNVPSTPVTPKPSTMFWVRRNGTFSGIRSLSP